MVNINDIIEKGQKHRPEIETTHVDKFFRFFSKYVSFFLIKIRVKPNQVTILGIMFAILGGFALSSNLQYGYLYASISFFLFLLFDYCDGEMARVMEIHSMEGHYLDYMGHFIMFSSFMSGLTYGIYDFHQKNVFLIIGLLGLIGILLRSISELLISEVIVREKLRTKKRLVDANTKIDYSLPQSLMDREIKGILSQLKFQFIKRLIIYPTAGDSILIFFIPLSLVFLFFSFPIYSLNGLRFIDLYFIYISSFNLIISLYSMIKIVRQNRIQVAYYNLFNENE